ncbi:MAG: beta-ketoacyl synthase N-terminal-like domain-containing protein [bacterium]
MTNPDAIVITGIGAVTPIGQTAEGLWRGALSGKSAVRRVTRFDPSPFISHTAAEINDFDPTIYLDAKQIRRLDRYSQFAVACATQALEDANLDQGDVPSDRVGVCLGTALGGIGYAEEQHLNYIERGLKAVSPMLALTIFAGAGSCNIAIEFGFSGPASANGDSCASGPIALGNAFQTAPIRIVENCSTWDNLSWCDLSIHKCNLFRFELVVGRSLNDSLFPLPLCFSELLDVGTSLT